MKWGDVYDADYVNILYKSVKNHLTLEYRFVCLTDDPRGLLGDIETFPLPYVDLPQRYRDHGGWLKLCVFQSELYDLQGPTLFLDLDVVVLESLTPFFLKGLESGTLMIIRDWPVGFRKIFRHRPAIGNSSVFFFHIGSLSQVYDEFITDPLLAVRRFRNEQKFLSYYARQKLFWPEEWCRSFKRHCVRSFPLSTFKEPVFPSRSKVIVFHGQPKPQTLAHVPWIAKNWHQYKVQ